MPIRNMMNYACAPNFNTFDYFIANSVRPELAGDFYLNRTQLLKAFLYSGDGKDVFSVAEKNFLVKQYEAIQTPFSYEYKEGWSRLLQNSGTVIMISALILGYLVAGIFSNEFRWRSDAIFFTTAHGRNSGRITYFFSPVMNALEHGLPHVSGRTYYPQFRLTQNWGSVIRYGRIMD